MAEAGFRVTGRVQGVGYRWWTRSLAQRLGLSGSVRNRTDGSVEVHASGADGPLERFAAQLRNGPALARVDDVQPIPFQPTARAGFHADD